MSTSASMPPLSQPFVTFALVVATAMIQLAAQLALDGAMLRLPRPRAGQVVSLHKAAVAIIAISVLMCGHLAQVALWGLRYYQWGELHSLANSMYFSLASFTTVGASDLDLSKAHRFTGAIEAALGMLMFGWSTAILIRLMQRSDHALD